MNSPLIEAAKQWLSKYLPSKLYEELLRKCNKNEVFLIRYLYNAVLSFIEMEEQRHIREMDFEKWILIEYKKFEGHVKEYIRRLLRACNLHEDLANLLGDDNLRELVVDAIAYLSYYGPNINESAKLLRILGDNCEQGSFQDHRMRVMELLKDGKLYVRSLLIEIANYLVKLKQRFPDRSTFQSPRLIDRIFVYAEPRELPLDSEDINSMRGLLKSLATRLYRDFVSVLERQRHLVRINELESKVSDLIDRYVDLVSAFLPRLYKYQYRGIRESLAQVADSLETRKPTKTVILLKAPTGSGKTEIFVITSVITALAYRLAMMTFQNVSLKELRAPLILILYPRRSLATDQLRRIVKHVYIVNKAAKEVLETHDPLLRISINYTEVRRKKEYLKALKRCAQTSQPTGLLKLKFGVQAPFERRNDCIIVRIPLLICPACEQDYLSFEYDVNKRTVLGGFTYLKCQRCNEGVDFISITKEDVYKFPGDLHVSLAETLRRDLMKVESKGLFGNGIDYGALIIVLDEIHTLTGVHGARIAYLLGRVVERIRRTTGIFQRPVIFIALSATIPESAKQNFIPKFFKVDSRNVFLLEPSNEELIPLGNEYFFITIPTTSELVDNLTVTIQTVMAIYCNMPSHTRSLITKRGFVFVDNLDTIKRLRDDLSDAMFRKSLIKGIKGGLQDLRNPRHQVFKETTLKDYVNEEDAWKDGEVWYPYTFEYELLTSLSKGKDPETKIGIYTSRRKDPINEFNILITDSALEVGVDYSDVVLIHQHGMPLTIASLIQRAGRGGRIVRENPLVRTAIAAQLSPYMPSQAAFLERLVREESLKKLIEYEHYDIPLMSPKILEQVVAEVVLDYLAFSANKPNNSYPLFIEKSRLYDFICKEYLETLKDEKFYEYLMNALINVGPLHLSEQEKIKNVVDRLLSRIEEWKIQVR